MPYIEDCTPEERACDVVKGGERLLFVAPFWHSIVDLLEGSLGKSVRLCCAGLMPR